LEFPNCLAIIIINYTPTIKPFSGAVAGEEVEDLCKGSFEAFRSIVNQKISYGCEQEIQDLI
jgi:hypothetical protein